MLSSAAYRLNSRKVQRSIVAAVAYAGGLRLRDERTVRLHDYRARRRADRDDVLNSIQFSPSVLNESIESFWNRVTKNNKNHWAVYGRRVLQIIPKQLSLKGMWRVGRVFARYLARKYRVAVFTALHGPRRRPGKRHSLEHADEMTDSNGNWHLHTYLSYCIVNRDGTLGTKQVLLDPKSCDVLNLPNFCEVERAIWAECVNRQLAREGIDGRVDHRSNEARRISDQPTEHLGPHFAALERRGIRTVVGDRNRAVQKKNERTRREVPHLENLNAIVAAMSEVVAFTDRVRPRRMRQWLAKVFHQGRRPNVRAFSRRHKIVLMDDGGAITVDGDAAVISQPGTARQAHDFLDAVQAELAHDESMEVTRRIRMGSNPSDVTTPLRDSAFLQHEPRSDMPFAVGYPRRIEPLIPMFGHDPSARGPNIESAADDGAGEINGPALD